MRFSLNWLQDFFKTDLLQLELAEALTCSGLEVDAVETVNPQFEGVIVAQVTAITAHPNADKLCIATVFDGKEHLQVVCGASNCRADLITAFAPIGSHLIDKQGKKHLLKKGVLRSIESFGMLLSAEELGLDEKSEGIIELNESFKIGQPLAPLFQDTVLDISFTPNLGHAMSHLGIAREVSCLFEKPYKIPPVKEAALGKFKTEDYVSLDVQSSKDCLSYSCILIKNVQVGPSPLWLQQRLKMCGVKSINNVVDVTNYLLHELGHPLHAYDFDLIEGGEIQVGTSRSSSLKTLDQVERELYEGCLLIEDQSGPIAIAGVMGGARTQVTNETVHVLLEAAHFSPQITRKMSRTLGLYTEASKHFERGVDNSMILKALQRAADLIQNIAGGLVAKEPLSYALKAFKPKIITCRPSFVSRILGVSIPEKEMEAILKRLEFGVEKKEDLLEIAVPSYRNDINHEIDFVEEIARIYGLNHLNQQKLTLTPSVTEDCFDYQIEKKLHQCFLQEGLQEVISCDLVSPEMNALHTGQGLAINTLNYMSQEQSSLRTSLLASHLQVMKKNQDHQMPNIQIYEIGQIYSMQGDCFSEVSQAAVSLMGSPTPAHYLQSEKELNFFHLKGILENVFEELTPEKLTFEKSSHAFFHPGIQADILHEEVKLGFLGQIHPKILRKSGLKKPVFFASFATTPFIALNARPKEINPLALYPSSERDWTFTCLDDLQIGHLLQLLLKIPSRILKDVYLLDLYRSEKIGLDRKNVTLRFVYRNDKKTLSFEAIEVEHAKMICEAQTKMKSLIIQPT